MGQTKCPSCKNLVIFNNEEPPNLPSGFVNPQKVQTIKKLKVDITCPQCGKNFIVALADENCQKQE